MRHRYKAVNPDRVIRDLRQEFKKIQKGDPEFTAPAFLADFTRRAHDLRMINKALHTAQLCLEAAPREAAQLLTSSYLEGVEDLEDELRAWAELANLARWLDHGELAEQARDRAGKLAVEWLGEVGGGEQRTRLRELGSMFDEDFADRALAANLDL